MSCGIEGWRKVRSQEVPTKELFILQHVIVGEIRKLVGVYTSQAIADKQQAYLEEKHPGSRFTLIAIPEDVIGEPAFRTIY